MRNNPSLKSFFLARVSSRLAPIRHARPRYVKIVYNLSCTHARLYVQLYTVSGYTSVLVIKCCTVSYPGCAASMGAYMSCMCNTCVDPPTCLVYSENGPTIMFTFHPPSLHTSYTITSPSSFFPPIFYNFDLFLLSEAYVSLVTNDDYSMGALALGRSLRDSMTQRKLSLLITSEVSHQMR